ncbi:hypothetical protein J1614_001943 [Plenodomus biglobosus]|nr:hypothetical protein J1614_001943 [Plenodomus biglobosus]
METTKTRSFRSSPRARTGDVFFGLSPAAVQVSKNLSRHRSSQSASGRNNIHVQKRGQASRPLSSDDDDDDE